MAGATARPGSRRGPPAGVTVFAIARINKTTSYPCIAPQVQKHAPPRLCANATYRRTLGASVKKTTQRYFAAKRQENKEDIMNSQRTKQHICKPHKPTHDRSLQKSCFLADAPANIDTFAVI